jgi:hypothetical protein
MPVSETLVESVVRETSERLKDPSYGQLAVGDFVQSQRNVSQYLSSRAAKMGGAPVVVTLVFHAQILSECLRKERGSDVPVVDFPTLDRAAQGDAQANLHAREPALANYIASNVDEAALRLELCKVALALSFAAAAREKKR